MVLEVIPFLPSQPKRNQIRNGFDQPWKYTILAESTPRDIKVIHSTQEYQAGSPVSFACRFVSVLIWFTVPGRYGSCRFGFYGSVRFAGTLKTGFSSCLVGRFQNFSPEK